MPASSDPPSLSVCPACQQPCLWSPQRAGRRLRCACGQIFRMPDAEGGPIVSEAAPASPTGQPAPPPAPTRATKLKREIYEVDLPDDLRDTAAAQTSNAPADTQAPSASATTGKCHSCNIRLRAGAVICLNCGFSLTQGGKLKTRIDTEPESLATDTPPSPTTTGITNKRLKRTLKRIRAEEAEHAEHQKHSRFQEHTLPLIFTAAGVLVAVFNGLVLAQPSQNTGLTANELSWGLGVSRSQAALTYFTGAATLLVIQIPCLLAGLMACTSLLGSAFGTLSVVLKKLLALAALGGSCYLSISMGVNIVMYGAGLLGGTFTISVAIAMFWVLAVQLFDDLKVFETIALYLAMCVMPFCILLIIQLATAG